MDWNEERVATLTKLWQEGLSASQVARHLGGISRNAVIGKVHRMGLAVREAPSRPRAVGVKPAPRVRVRASAGGTLRRAATPRPLRITALEPLDVAPTCTMHTLAMHSCRWPIGDPQEDGFGYCGRPKAGSGSYCAGHTAMAFRSKKLDVERVINSVPELAQPKRVAGY